MSFGDYIQLQRENIPAVADLTITSADQTTIVASPSFTVKSAKHQIFVQRITLSITTHVNAKVALTVQSSNGTPVPIFSRTDVTAAAGVPDVITCDFGPLGHAIAVGESLHVLWSTGGSGPTGKAHIEGYQRIPAGPITPAQNSA